MWWAGCAKGDEEIGGVGLNKLLILKLKFDIFPNIKTLFRACWILVFAMKNEENRPFFKEKTQADSYSIRQVFDEEKQSDHLTG